MFMQNPGETLKTSIHKLTHPKHQFAIHTFNLFQKLHPFEIGDSNIVVL